MPTQPRLFASEDPLAARHARQRRLAAQLDPLLHFGTSSWSFPGWAGIVYRGAPSESVLARTGLSEYAESPLFRTVGIDRGYYAPIPARDLQRYDAQLPPGFRACIKAPATVTSAVLPGDPRATPQANPDYLSATRYLRDMGDALAAHFAHRTAMVIFEFPPMVPSFRLSVEDFAARLDDFLGALPRSLGYAVELRESAHFRRVYADVLAKHGVSHVYNYWSAMPSPGRQARHLPVASQPRAVLRLLLAPGTKYAERKAAFAPFSALKAVDPSMRGEVVAMVREALAARRETFVLVNNKAEGSSPLTIEALAEALSG
ncbi:MAG: DUF72 domain-containing protein [Myxococcales bacterium]|nr:DUF72 domain-containing protein [Myxococcales bacterium]